MRQSPSLGAEFAERTRTRPEGRVAGEVIVVGTVGGPFGVRGWVKVRSFTEPPENLLAYRPWQIAAADANAWRVVRARVRAHGDGFVARIDDTTDRDVASTMRGWRIGVAPELLPAPEHGKHYWRDLVGQRVVRQPPEGAPEQSLGVVRNVFATPAHDVLVVADGDRERLIPFVRQVVVDVDENAGRMVVEWDPAWQ